MSSKKKILGIMLSIIISTVLISVPTNACYYFGPTSLEIWKENVKAQPVEGGIEVKGCIVIQNDPFNNAWIASIEDVVESKYKDGDWELRPVIDGECSWGEYEIKPGKFLKIEFTFVFEDAVATAYRNVFKVTLNNHPTGVRDYYYRLSFDVDRSPILKIGQNIAPPSFWEAGTQKLITIDVLNDGLGIAEDVVLTVEIPTAYIGGNTVKIMSIDGVSDDPTIQDNIIVWDLDSIDPGDTKSVTLTSTLDSRLLHSSEWYPKMTAEPSNGPSHEIYPKIIVVNPVT